MAEIIVCQNCGQKNKIEGNEKDEIKCVKCCSLINKKVKNNENIIIDKKNESKSKGIVYELLWIICIYVIFSLALGIYIHSNPDTSLITKSSRRNIKIKNDYPIVSMPYSGQEQKFVNNECLAPLTIKTSSEANYLVKIVDYYSKSDVMTIFITGGDTIRTKVPSGTFEIRYASGNQWYGYTHLFGNDTSYSKADQSFDFRNTGYTLTLYRVSNGNLITSYINPSEF